MSWTPADKLSNTKLCGGLGSEKCLFMFTNGNTIDWPYKDLGRWILVMGISALFRQLILWAWLSWYQWAGISKTAALVFDWKKSKESNKRRPESSHNPPVAWWWITKQLELTEWRLRVGAVATLSSARQSRTRKFGLPSSVAHSLYHQCVAHGDKCQGSQGAFGTCRNFEVLLYKRAWSRTRSSAKSRRGKISVKSRAALGSSRKKIVALLVASDPSLLASKLVVLPRGSGSFSTGRLHIYTEMSSDWKFESHNSRPADCGARDQQPI